MVEKFAVGIDGEVYSYQSEGDEKGLPVNERTKYTDGLHESTKTHQNKAKNLRKKLEKLGLDDDDLSVFGL